MYMHYGNHFVSLCYLITLIGYKTYHQLTKIFGFQMVYNLSLKTQEWLVY